MRRTILLVIVLALLAAALPVFAQTSLTTEQQESVSVVADALAALEELDSYTVHSDQTVGQVIEMTVGEQSMNVVNDIIQTVDFQVVKADEGYNAAGTLEQEVVSEVGGQSSSTTITFELVVLDGESYARVSGDAGPMASVMPEGWISLSDPSASANPLFTAISPDNLSNFYGMSVLIDDTTVLGIEEVDGTEIDGQAMRVFEIDYSPEELANNEMFSQMAESIGSGAAGMTAGDAEQLLQDMFEDAVITYTAYIGEDDGLLHQVDGTVAIEATISIQGMTLPLVMSVDSVTTFSNFNEPVTIEAPELGT